MKLLFDENLSYKLCARIQDRFPNSAHTNMVGHSTASGLEVWQYADENNFTIVTKDSDFNDIIVLNEFPPQAIWIRSGNVSVSAIEQLLGSKEADIKQFILDTKYGLYEI